MIITPAGYPNIQFKVRPSSKTDQVVINEIWRQNVYEVNQTHFMGNKIIVDVGANIGAFSILAAMHGGLVHSIEPESGNFEILQENIKLNDLQGQVITHNLAIGQNSRSKRIVSEDGNSRIVRRRIGTQKVKQVSLSEFFGSNSIDVVDFMKIDVEGS
jgi:FkbM family methyltransferase